MFTLRWTPRILFQHPRYWLEIVGVLILPSFPPDPREEFVRGIYLGLL